MLHLKHRLQTFKATYIISDYTISPLGDSALLLSFGNTISRKINRNIIAIANHFTQKPFCGLIDIIPAYSSITFSFNLYAISIKIIKNGTVFDCVKQQVEQEMGNIKATESKIAELVEIPVCYDPELGNDMASIMSATSLSEASIIQHHSAKKYYVYMLGFLPGFAYMGEVDDHLTLPRKMNPAKVKAGSVAIAGKQTGIYPLDSFGGWNVLGHTPVKIFNYLNAAPCYLKAGQEVKFYPVSLAEYRQFQSKALH